jgi:Fe-S-cluster containining protein
MKPQRQCRRCGTCCRKGGPVLHHEDLALVRRNVLSLHQLVTIRKGEPAYDPFLEKVAPAGREMIKIAGKGASWECLFYDAGRSACLIHAERPLECRLLQCWDTSAIEAVSRLGHIGRLDLLDSRDPMADHVSRHEKSCAYDLALPLWQSLWSPAPPQSALQELTAVMQEDLRLRGKAVETFSLSLAQELFYFGRPLFQTLQHPCLRVILSGQTLHLSLTPSA